MNWGDWKDCVVHSVGMFYIFLYNKIYMLKGTIMQTEKPVIYDDYVFKVS